MLPRILVTKLLKLGLKAQTLTAGTYITFRKRATGIFSNSRYFATVRRAIG